MRHLDLQCSCACHFVSAFKASLECFWELLRHPLKPTFLQKKKQDGDYQQQPKKIENPWKEKSYEQMNAEERQAFDNQDEDIPF